MSGSLLHFNSLFELHVILSITLIGNEKHVINTFHICACFGLIVWIELSI